MTADTMPTPRAAALLERTERLMTERGARLGRAKPRAVAVLMRRTLETALAEFLAHAAPGCDRAPFTSRLLVMRHRHPDPGLAAEVAWTWSALSAATHHQGYELNPSSTVLAAWLATVRRFVTTGIQTPKS